jgi:membrane-bound acyltransferase YfiQ involved in biofilm formation
LQKRLWLFVLIVISHGIYSYELIREDARVGYNPLLQFLIASLPYKFSASIFILAMLYKWKNAHWVKRMAASANDTYGIYLAHTSVLVIAFSAWLAIGHTTTHWSEVPLLWIAVWFTSQGIVRLAQRIRLYGLSPLLFGTLVHHRRS